MILKCCDKVDLNCLFLVGKVYDIKNLRAGTRPTDTFYDKCTKVFHTQDLADV